MDKPNNLKKRIKKKKKDPYDVVDRVWDKMSR